MKTQADKQKYERTIIPKKIKGVKTSYQVLVAKGPTFPAQLISGLVLNRTEVLEQNYAFIRISLPANTRMMALLEPDIDVQDQNYVVVEN
jgi:hypothetical protein